MALFGAGALYCFRRRKNGAYFSTAPSFALPTIEKEARGSTSRATTEESRSSKIESESSMELHSSRLYSPYAAPRLQNSTKATPAGGDVRLLSGPQSVPESNAFFERSSPGVRTHFGGPQDLDGDGLYPPLTPTSQYASSSIVIGVPPHLSSTISAGSMSVSSKYHEGDSSSMPGSPPMYSPSKSVSYRDTQKNSHAVDEKGKQVSTHCAE